MEPKKKKTYCPNNLNNQHNASKKRVTSERIFLSKIRHLNVSLSFIVDCMCFSHTKPLFVVVYHDKSIIKNFKLNSSSRFNYEIIQ